MAENKLNEIIQTSLEKIKELSETGTIIGDPINTAGGTVIIPVSKISLGFASGGVDIGMNQKSGGDSTKRRKFKGLFKGITFPMMLAYLLSTALLFFADYRRLVLEIAPDWLYWLSCGAGFVLSYTGSRHMYWAKIVGKHKKDAQNKAKPKKSFFDAWTSVLAIGLLVYGLLSLLITILISGIYDLGVIANLFAGFGG